MCTTSSGLDMKLFFIFLQEKAQLRRDEVVYMDHGSPPDMQAQIITQLTPPQSDKKNHVPNTPETPSENAVTYSWWCFLLRHSIQLCWPKLPRLQVRIQCVYCHVLFKVPYISVPLFKCLTCNCSWKKYAILKNVFISGRVFCNN